MNYPTIKLILTTSVFLAILFFNSCDKDDDTAVVPDATTGTGGGSTATCTDGVQNGDETGVDCGGSCTSCGGTPNCSDGIQNGDETGIDCGGSCTACGGSSIVGSWEESNPSCTNSSGDGAIYQFSNSTGSIFVADCNNYCTGLGYYLYFTYSISGSTINFTFTSNSGYCGDPGIVPGPSSGSFTLSGDILTMNGVSFDRV